jgi:hypothetical protein
LFCGANRVTVLQIKARETGKLAGQAMVERMTSVEIEDVLSSIRRLVTDDLRPKPVPVDSKLILTPALRVVPDVVAEPEVTDQMLDVDLDADLAAALSEDQPIEDAVDMRGDAAQVAEEQAAETYPMFLHHDRRVDLAPETTATEVADTVMTIGAGIPADGYEAELGDVMPVPEWPESSWVAPDVIEGVEEAEVMALHGQPDTAATDWAEDDVTAEVPVADDAADDMAAAAMAALAAEEAAEAAGNITELDEDMLREIVRDIIREELQGTLGEKITRNVRKLVRAEINRALITDDLD